MKSRDFTSIYLKEINEKGREVAQMETGKHLVPPSLRLGVRVTKLLYLTCICPCFEHLDSFARSISLTSTKDNQITLYCFEHLSYFSYFIFVFEKKK